MIKNICRFNESCVTAGNYGRMSLMGARKYKDILVNHTSIPVPGSADRRYYGRTEH